MVTRTFRIVVVRSPYGYFGNSRVLKVKDVSYVLCCHALVYGKKNNSPYTLRRTQLIEFVHTWTLVYSTLEDYTLVATASFLLWWSAYCKWQSHASKPRKKKEWQAFLIDCKKTTLTIFCFFFFISWSFCTYDVHVSDAFLFLICICSVLLYIWCDSRVHFVANFLQCLRTWFSGYCEKWVGWEGVKLWIVAAK